MYCGNSEIYDLMPEERVLDEKIIVNDNIRMYKKWNLYMYKNMHI